MRRLLVPLSILPALCVASCSFLLDFDSLQKGGPPDASVSGSGGVAGSAGAGAGNAGTAGSAGIPLSGLASTLAGALCADLKACYSSGLEFIIHDEDCTDLFTKTLTDTTTAVVQSSVTAGHLNYDPVKAAACVAQLTAASQASPPTCDDVGAMIEGCKSAVVGAGKSGDECNNSYECQIGTYCKLEGCPGVCATYPQLNDNCSSSLPCDPTKGLYCEVADADAGTGAGTCQAYIALGADCSRANSQCVPGGFCLGQKCQRLADVFTLNSGQTCYANGLLCNSGLSCEFSGVPLLSAASCVAEKAVSTPCKLAFPSECPKGDYCTAELTLLDPSPTGQCVGSPSGDQACAADTEQKVGISAPCAAGLICVNNICKPRKAIGEACELNEQCYSSFCAPSDGGMICAMPGCAP